MEQIRTFLSNVISNVAKGTHISDEVNMFIILALIILVGFILYFIGKLIVLPLLRKLSTAPKMQWLKTFLDFKVPHYIIRFVVVAIVMNLLPIAFTAQQATFYSLASAILKLYLVIIILKIFDYTISFSRYEMMQREKYRDHPLLGLFQVFKVIIYAIGVIYIISIVFSIPVNDILIKVGAMSAVLMLVFKDTILGFVAGIQLSANDMVKRGDWITMDKYGADGDVIDITLNTVKIRNFDKTITTIPPYALISDSFQNWRGMQNSGGRRVKRSLYLDMQTVKFADKELIDNMMKVPILKEYLEATMKDMQVSNEEKGLSDTIARRQFTNVGIFRNYVYYYLKNHDRVHKTYTCMVRQLQPTSSGLPMELYFFTDTTVWADYETIQADIFDHLMAVLPHFELTVFQNMNSTDMSKLTYSLGNMMQPNKSLEAK